MIQLLIQGEHVASVRNYVGPTPNDARGGPCSFTIDYDAHLPILGAQTVQLEFPDGSTVRMSVTSMSIDEELVSVHFTGNVLARMR